MRNQFVSKPVIVATISGKNAKELENSSDEEVVQIAPKRIKSYLRQQSSKALIHILFQNGV